MGFVSCRDSGDAEGKKRIYSFREAVLKGWADDGGMLMPEADKIPFFDRAALRSMAKLSYQDLCYKILRSFVPESPELTDADLQRFIAQAYESFGHPQVVTMTKLASSIKSQNSSSSPVYVAELWHGPTLAFKDLGMQLLGQLLNHFVGQESSNSKSKLVLLVGTSGDTGSAAIEAVRGLDKINIIVLYPLGRVSHIQEQQMTSAASEAKNVHVVGVEGTSDDLDEPIEALFRDQSFRKQHRIGSVNSVNICRLLVQIVHYFYCYLQIFPEADKPIAFSVPTGAGGHITAGVLARLMGLPIASLIAATNENDILSQWLKTGNFTAKPSVAVTKSSSMDIQVPYNIERLLYLFSNGSAQLVRAWMAEFRDKKHLSFTEGDLMRFRNLLGLVGCSTKTPETDELIKSVYSQEKYLLDPHTAVGVKAALRQPSNPALPTVCMGCAHPAKFEESLRDVFAVKDEKVVDLIPNQRHKHVHRILELRKGNIPPSSVFCKGDNWEEELRTLVVQLS